MGKDENNIGHNKLKKLEEEIKNLYDLLEEQKKTQSTIKIEVIKEISTVRENLDDKIGRKTSNTIAILGIILSVLGSLGYFGLKSSIPSYIDKKIGTQVTTELKNITDTAERSLAIIKSLEQGVERPLIVVQTDYGNDAAYMGSLLGEIYKINPNARVQISTSGIEDFNIIHAAWTLWRSSRLYPAGTIFLAITNPGGTENNVRKIVLVTKNNLVFIGHDNGIFDMVVQNLGHKETYVISSPEFTPVEITDLFGGIDIFGPTAAKISLGCDMNKIGPIDLNYKMKLPNVAHQVLTDEIKGTVMDIDNFKNVTLNISNDDLEKINKRIGNTIIVKFNDRKIVMPLKNVYGEVPKGSLVAVFYDGYLQLAINIGYFNNKYQLQRGSLVEIE
jgi:S-adenosylmethionine hydrolase